MGILRNYCLYLTLLFCFFLTSALKAQQDTTAVDLLQELNGQQPTSTSVSDLLPRKMLPTQRLLWGEKGLMRKFDRFELTPEKRQNELKVRRFALKAHQAIGLATLGAMIAQGIVGAKLYNGDYQLKDVHEGLAAAINTGYFTTAGLSFFAPPKAVDERKGFSSIKAHRWLAAVHLSGMIATNILADRVNESNTLRAAHRAAAFSAFGAYAAAVLVIKF